MSLAEHLFSGYRVPNPKLTGERMNKVNEASPANKVSDVERVVI